MNLKLVAVIVVVAIITGIVGYLLASSTTEIRIPEDIKKIANTYTVRGSFSGEAAERYGVEPGSIHYYVMEPIHIFEHPKHKTKGVLYGFYLTKPYLLEERDDPEMLMAIYEFPGEPLHPGWFSVEFSRMGWAEMWIYENNTVICHFDTITEEGKQMGYYSYAIPPPE